MWFLATCGEEPNVAPVGFKRIDGDGTFVIGAMLLETTQENIKKNSRIAIAAANPLTAAVYQIKGRTVLTTEKLIVASPNAENKQELLL